MTTMPDRLTDKSINQSHDMDGCR